MPFWRELASLLSLGLRQHYCQRVAWSERMAWGKDAGL